MSYYQFNTHLTLSGDPVNPMHAVTKQYVDSKGGAVSGTRFQTGTLDVQKLPALLGDVFSAQGTNTLTLVDSGVTAGVKYRVDVDAKGRVISGDTTSQTANRQNSWSWVTGKPSLLAAYGITDVVSTSGGTAGAALLSSVDASAANHAVRKSQVDTTLAAVNMSAAVTGDIITSSVQSTPTGFLKVNGAVLDKTTYAALYAIIGDAYVTNGGIGYMGQPWKQQYAFNTTQSADITGWGSTAQLPATVAYSQSVVTKNRVYLLGGYEGGVGFNANVYTAAINADGTLGAWASGTALPGIIGGAQAIVTKNRVYLLGGINSGTYLSTTYTAPINSDGTIGAWTAAGSLPGPLGYSQAVVTQNRVYLIGGIGPSGYSSSVFTAPINSDGTLGTWTTSTAIPDPIGYSQMAITKNRLYLLGGHSSSYGAATDSIYTAPINADGTLGTWTSAGTLPIKAANSNVIVVNGRVYLLGGNNATAGYLSVTYNAPINADGTLGAWVPGSGLPALIGYSQVVVTKSRVYLLGGIINNTHSSSTYVTTFSGGTNDYIALIAANAINSSTEFRLPDFTAKETSKLYYFIKY